MGSLGDAKLEALWAEHAEVREGKGEIVTKDAAGMQAWGEEVCKAVASTMAEARLALHHGSTAIVTHMLSSASLRLRHICLAQGYIHTYA